MSKRDFTQQQILLLTRGPKFCPSTRGNTSDFCGDTRTFTKKLIIRERFFDQSWNDESLIRAPSKKYITTYNKELTDIISFVNKINPQSKEHTDNLDKGEQEALRELVALSRSEIEIKKADKSNTLIIMDKEEYKNKLVLEGHLNTPTYERSDVKANERVYKDLVELCDKYELCLTPAERKVILKKDWSESNFYVLPKIHKSKEILRRIQMQPSDHIKMTMPDDLKGRPINGDVNSVTHGLSKLLEKILKPLVPQLRTFIKDEFDFVDKIPRKVRTDVYAVSCDVTSLYTSIPLELGIEAITHWLSKLSHLIPQRFSSNFVIESIQFVLENNYFSFDGTIWRQCIGTAMGKAFAPPYACLTMGFLEETRLFPCLLPANFDEETTALIIEFFFRFIDDNFNLLPNAVTPNIFLRILNSMHSAIQYTIALPTPYEYDSKASIFLSLAVIINTLGDVKTNVHYKETNAHDYLQFDSHHPHHTKINIPYTLAKRIYLLTSEGEWIKKNLEDLKDFLLARKYPANVIDRGIHNALLQGPAPQPKGNTRSIPLISTFYSNYDCRNISNVTSDLIRNSKNKRIQDAFRDVKFIQSTKQPKNLLQLLSNSRFITAETFHDQQKPKGIFHCDHGGCKICKLYLQKCTSFLTSNGSTWDVKCYADCHSKNVLYFLICNVCNSESYSGKTDDMRGRTNDHISKIRKCNSTNKFDIHVYNCAKKKKVVLQEPFFKAYIFMVVSDYNKLLNLERKMHLAGHDTMNS